MSEEYILPLTAEQIEQAINKALNLDLSKYYTKTEIDAIMQSYINDIDALIGGDA